MTRSLRSLVMLAALALPATLAAQAVPQPAGVAIPTPKNQVLSVQPINVVLTIYTAEYERKMGNATTLGFGGTYWNDSGDGDDLTYASADVKLRYYPNAKVFQGFSFGVQGGVTHLSETLTSDFTGGTEEKNSATGPSFGVALDYGWLLGATRSFYVGLGVGAKAVFIDENDFNDATVRYPTARVSVGYAF